MARKTPNDRLRALQFEAGWSAESLARAVNTLGAAQGLALRYDRSSVAHWLAGAQPRPRVGMLVAEALARRLGRPLTPADIGIARDPGSPRGDAALMAHEALISSVADLAAAAADPVRHPYHTTDVYPLLQVRNFIATLPDLVAQGRGGPSTPLPASAADEPDNRLSTQQLSHCEAVSFFQRQAETHGGGAVRGSLAAYVRAACTKAVPTREGNSALAALTAALAWAHSDDSAPGMAWTLYEHALHLALRSADQCGVIYALEAMGAQALDLGHPAEAVALSKAAGLAATGHGPVLRAGIQIQLAAALASEGRAQEAARVLALAEPRPRYAQKKDDTAPAPLWSPTASPRTAWHQRIAQIFTTRREAAKAVGHLRLALRHRASHDQRGAALTHVLLCRALLATGRTESACQHGLQACDIAARLRSSAVRDALAALTRHLAPHHRSPDARNLGSRLALT